MFKYDEMLVHIKCNIKIEADMKYLPNDDILLRRSKVEIPTIFGTN